MSFRWIQCMYPKSNDDYFFLECINLLQHCLEIGIVDDAVLTLFIEMELF